MALWARDELDSTAIAPPLPTSARLPVNVDDAIALRLVVYVQQNQTYGEETRVTTQ